MRKAINIAVHFKGENLIREYNSFRAWYWGNFYCIECEDDQVVKIPVNNIEYLVENFEEE